MIFATLTVLIAFRTNLEVFDATSSFLLINKVVEIFLVKSYIMHYRTHIMLASFYVLNAFCLPKSSLVCHFYCKLNLLHLFNL